LEIDHPAPAPLVLRDARSYAAYLRRELRGVRFGAVHSLRRVGGRSRHRVHPPPGAARTPAVMEDAGRDTAENASRSLPLIAAMGDVRRVTVVTSAWHLRAPYFFAPYRRFGLRVSFRFTLRGRWLRMVRHELRHARRMRAERTRAMADVRMPPEIAEP
jgi:hypothetical protein